MPTDNGITRSRSGGMSVSLAGPDGRVLGGGLAGLLIASGPVQVNLWSMLDKITCEIAKLGFSKLCIKKSDNIIENAGCSICSNHHKSSFNILRLCLNKKFN